MKKNKFTVISSAFLTGTLFGISLFAVLSFSSPDNPPPANPPFTEIDTITANYLVRNYYNSSNMLPDKFKGFLVDKDQLEAMKELLKSSPDLSGFRIYMGKNMRGETVTVVVGVGSTLSDAKKGKVYQTESAQSGPCPFICDETSPISNTH